MAPKHRFGARRQGLRRHGQQLSAEVSGRQGIAPDPLTHKVPSERPVTMRPCIASTAPRRWSRSGKRGRSPRQLNDIRFPQPSGDRKTERCGRATRSRVDVLLLAALDDAFGMVPDDKSTEVSLFGRVRGSSTRRRQAAMPDSPTNTTSMFQISWPGGTMTLRCVGVPPITEKGSDEIKNVMQEFSADCQMMLVWFSAVLGSQQAMRSHLARIAEHDEPFTTNRSRRDGIMQTVTAPGAGVRTFLIHYVQPRSRR